MTGKPLNGGTMQGSEGEVRLTKDQIVKWKADAIADGWELTPTYQHESVDRACSLRRDGYHAMLLTRDPIDGHWDTNPEYTIHCWCPKGIALQVPAIYSFAALVANQHVCGECGQVRSQTRRVGFANRVCDECYPKAKAQYEKPGWCD